MLKPLLSISGMNFLKTSRFHSSPLTAGKINPCCEEIKIKQFYVSWLFENSTQMGHFSLWLGFSPQEVVDDTNYKPHAS